MLHKRHMGQLNIRNVPDEAMRRWKSEAAQVGVTLREWVLERLGVDSVETYTGVEIKNTEAKERLKQEMGRPANTPSHLKPKPNIRTANAVLFPNRQEHHPTCKCGICAARKGR